MAIVSEKSYTPVEFSRRFTLIEVLLAMTIFTMVLLIAGTGLVMAHRMWVKCQEGGARLRRLVLIDRVVDSNFRGIVPFSWRNPQNRNQEIFFGDPDKIVFASLHGIGSMATGALRFMRLRIDNGDLLAEYSNTPLLYWDDSISPKHVEILSSKVEKLEFNYADYNSAGELVWDTDWDENARRNIPVAVMMKITWENGETAQWLRRTAGNGPDESYGRRINDRY